jgi:hypothetical protein
MNNIEQKSRVEKYRLPLFLTTAIVSFLLLVGGGVSSRNNSSAEVVPSRPPVPVLDNQSLPVTPDPSLDITLTPAANQAIETPIPNAGPIVNPDGSVSPNQ